MTSFFFLILLFFLICLFFYNIILVLLMIEFFSLFIYCQLTYCITYNLITYSFLLLFSCFMVMEAIASMSVLLVSYRFFGKKFFLSW